MTESKVTEIFCIADDFCKEFEVKDSNKKCNGILLTLPQGKAARRGG